MPRELFDDSQFGEETEMSSNTIDWGRVGDFLTGTFVKARHNVETQFGQNSIYDFVAEKGSFHKLTKKKPADQPTEVNKGDSVSIWGRNDVLNGQLNSLKPGQVVKVSFVEERDTQMGTAKIIKIYAPRDNEGKVLMNQEWLDAQGVTGGDL